MEVEEDSVAVDFRAAAVVLAAVEQAADGKRRFDVKVERSSDPVLFFSKSEKKAIVESIQNAEKSTSAEIRVHLERKAKPDIMQHAREVFARLGMTETQQRNGVLIFLGVQSKRFAIIGDEGIHSKVNDDFWNKIAERMVNSFKEDQFSEGIALAVEQVGMELSKHFPYQEHDVNELPDEISYSI